MSEIGRKHFFERLDQAPHAARGFFESIIEHFDRRNDSFPHHTDTNGGDLRLAIEAELLDRKQPRNFATMYWQSKNNAVFARTFLTPFELSQMGYSDGVKPKSETEPLNSEIHLHENDWRYGVERFIQALESARAKAIPD